MCWCRGLRCGRSISSGELCHDFRRAQWGSSGSGGSRDLVIGKVPAGAAIRFGFALGLGLGPCLKLGFGFGPSIDLGLGLSGRGLRPACGAGLKPRPLRRAWLLLRGHRCGRGLAHGRWRLLRRWRSSGWCRRPSPELQHHAPLATALGEVARVPLAIDGLQLVAWTDHRQRGVLLCATIGCLRCDDTLVVPVDETPREDLCHDGARGVARRGVELHAQPLGCRGALQHHLEAHRSGRALTAFQDGVLWVLGCRPRVPPQERDPRPAHRPQAREDLRVANLRLAGDDEVPRGDGPLAHCRLATVPSVDRQAWRDALDPEHTEAPGAPAGHLLPELHAPALLLEALDLRLPDAGRRVRRRPREAQRELLHARGREPLYHQPNRGGVVHSNEAV
mmetsp:Transcript_46365/g.148040  ORF Transcript_46365/g.148040 Transcript_46365/m.148040 type:complete len:392 (-) Transcript_46365:1696-2871(-)